MRKCELCNSVARMYCDSDRASLCWDCDGRVHAANFLVAKHSRTLLCHVCQAPTPWTGSGPKLGPTVSVCENCVHARNGENNGGDEADIDSDSGDDGDGGDGDEDDGDNQVVPLSLAPPLVSGSSGSEGSGGSRNGEEAEPGSAAGFSAKQTGEIADIFSDVMIPSSPVFTCSDSVSNYVPRPPGTAREGRLEDWLQLNLMALVDDIIGREEEAGGGGGGGDGCS